MYKPLRLTKETAKKIVKKVLGVSGNGLVKNEDGSDTYEMKQGELIIKVENDWYEENGLYVLEISHNSFVLTTMRMYFRPDTLEEDMEAEEKWLSME